MLPLPKRRIHDQTILILDKLQTSLQTRRRRILPDNGIKFGLIVLLQSAQHHRLLIRIMILLFGVGQGSDLLYILHPAQQSFWLLFSDYQFSPICIGKQRSLAL